MPQRASRHWKQKNPHSIPRAFRVNWCVMPDSNRRTEKEAAKLRNRLDIPDCIVCSDQLS